MAGVFFMAWRFCYDAAMDKTALAITLLIALIAASLVFARLYFSGQSFLS